MIYYDFSKIFQKRKKNVFNFRNIFRLEDVMQKQTNFFSRPEFF